MDMKKFSLKYLVFIYLFKPTFFIILTKKNTNSKNKFEKNSKKNLKTNKLSHY